MSLDASIYSQSNDSTSKYEHILSWEDDGYYWFLFPMFERLHQITGQMIDLYDTATFAGQHLSDLHIFIEEVLQTTELQPDTWEQCIAIQVVPEHQEIYRTVHKTTLQTMLTRLSEATARAEKQGATILFIGD